MVIILGVETVNLEFRRESNDHFAGIQCDIASAKIHHTMNPSKNYVFGEFRMPALSKHMPSVDYDMIVDTFFHDCMHQMRYLQVDNKTFHNFMNNEGTPKNQDNRSCGETTDRYYSYREREGIDVVRHIHDNGKVFTYYNSNQRTLGPVS
jgi:hypothetical protein